MPSDTRAPISRRPSDQIQRPRRILLERSPRANRTWSDVQRLPRRWSAEELAVLADSDFGVGRVRGESDELILIVDTDEGTFERVIPRVSPVRIIHSSGSLPKPQCADAAATWGLPDFVMVPHVERKGRGVREISDGLLVVGARGVIVQSKARETEPGTAARESSWIDKKIGEAAKQVHGTGRRLTREPTAL